MFFSILFYIYSSFNGPERINHNLLTHIYHCKHIYSYNYSYNSYNLYVLEFICASISSSNPHMVAHIFFVHVPQIPPQVPLKTLGVVKV